MFTSLDISKAFLMGPGAVVYAYNPSYSGGRDRRIKIQGQPRKKLTRPPSQTIKYSGTSLWSQLHGRQGQEDHSLRLDHRQKCETLSKKWLKAQKGWRHSSSGIIEHLLNTHQVQTPVLPPKKSIPCGSFNLSEQPYHCSIQSLSLSLSHTHTHTHTFQIYCQRNEVSI
jgi:hypothetical protein